MCRRWLHLHMYLHGHGSLFWSEGVCDHENYSKPQTYVWVRSCLESLTWIFIIRWGILELIYLMCMNTVRWYVWWFVMIWLNIDPLQPISSKKDVLCYAKNARTGHIISFARGCTTTLASHSQRGSVAHTSDSNRKTWRGPAIRKLLYIVSPIQLNIS